MRILCFLSCLVLLFVIVVAPAAPVYAAETCPFISARELAGAMPAAKWSLISNQDGRGCIYQGGRGDTLMLAVHRNPSAERAKDLYAQFIKTLRERMPVAPVAGIGDESQAGTTTSGAARPEASIVTLSGDYILSITVYRSGRPADDTLLKPLTEVARRAIGNVGATSERFGGCEWLTADDAEGFLDRSTLTIQRTGAGSCMMFDGAANTMVVAVITMGRDTQVSMMNRKGRVPARRLARARPGGVRRAFLHQRQRQCGQHLRLEEWQAGVDPVRTDQAASRIRIRRAPEGRRGSGARETVAGAKDADRP